MKHLTWRKDWAKKEKARRNVGRLPGTMLLWKGLSLLDCRTPVIAVASVAGISPSENRKTGDMIQVAIMRSDASPINAWKLGLDDAVCPEDCIHRSRPRGGLGSCYVNKARLESTWLAGVTGPTVPKEELVSFGEGAIIRLGMEGDPAAVPLSVWLDLVDRALGWSAYTAHWRRLPIEWSALCMASCSSPEEADEAEAKGWRTFTSSRSLAEDEEHASVGRRVCLAESHDVPCSACRGCNGVSRGTRRPSFHLPLHGAVGSSIRRRMTEYELQVKSEASTQE